MNWDQIEGQWKQLKGTIREKWAKLTDSDFEEVKGKRDRLVGKVQEKYGCMKEDAERQVDEFASTCGCGPKSAKSSNYNEKSNYRH